MAKINQYSPTNWTGGDEITADSLNNIEAGIRDATAAIVEAQTGDQSLHQRISAIESATGVDYGDSISSLRTDVNNLSNSLTTIQGQYTTIAGNIPANLQATLAAKANSSDVNSTLDTLTAAINTIKTAVDGYNDVENEVSDAHFSLTLNVDYDSLDARFEAIEGSLNSSSGNLGTRITALENEVDINNANGSRIDTLETNIATKASATDLATLAGVVNDATTGLAATKAIADAAVTSEELTSALSSKANTATTDALDTRLDAIDGGATLDTTNGTLAARVGALESNPITSTIIIPANRITYNNSGIPTIYTDNTKSTAIVPSADIDYLLEKDNQYYYWKYINNNWELISGGSEGGGTSSAEFYAAVTDVPEPPSDTVDYFIGSGSNYIHYRYRNNNWVMILPNHLINSVSVDTSAVSAEENAPTKSRPIIKEIGSNTNLLGDFTAIKSITYETTENGTKLIWTDIDGEVQDVTITGGGGGTSSNVTAYINRVTDANLTAIAGETCIINYVYSATERNNNQEEIIATTGNGIWFINGARVATQSVTVNDVSDNTDYNTFDITQYLRTGTNNITLEVTIIVNGETIKRTKTWVITVINFSLLWDYDESTINTDNVINFSCIPYGTDITKTLHLKVGVNEQTQIVTTSGIPVTVSLANNFNHGNYTAEMWMTATINGQPETTEHIFHDFLVVESGNMTPIIAATLPSSTMNQYNTISIPFVVYTPNSNISNISLVDNGVVIDTREVGRTTQTWHYTPTTLGVNIIYDENENPVSGTHVLAIRTGSVTKTLNLTVNSININNTEIGGYTFKLKASELPSNNALQSWCYDSNDPDNTKLQFSNNFDWVNGGIKTEYDDANQLRQYIRIKSGTTMTIPYQIFATDPRTNGMNFKIIFKIDNCRDYDATVATNVAENIGIQLNAHGATFKSTTTQISTQYGEEEYTELEFEVYKALNSNGTDASNRYMIAWVDGVISTARAYGGNFVQTNATNFVIGSNDCDICVYLVKYYPKVLSISDHITNFIADAPNAVEMIARYNRNDILDEDDDIDYNRLAQKNPDCRVWLYDIARMTKAKDDSVDVYNFQQIWEGGDQYYQLQGTNAKMKIQGTSSVNYRYGAANTDIDFRTSKAPNATLVDGYGNNLLDSELEYKGFKINDDSIPIEYSNTKVNFASCEQVNNMCNAEWYQRYQPFPSLSARDCMEFAMGVQFIKDHHIDEPLDGIELFTEKGADFNPEKYYMYSIANMGTSKKNTHIFHSDNECCIEIKENTSDAQKMKSFDSAWTDSNDNTQNYEMRYPDIKPTQVTNDIKTGWARFVNWMVASNPGAATNAALAESVTFEPYTFRGHNRTVTEVEGRNFAQVLRGTSVSQYAGTYDHDTFEYRMAKMLSECEDYMAMDSIIYHFCFIERHTMVDNVAKNTFWSSVKEVGGPNDEEGYWIWDLSKNYDNDTSDGNNNNGLLVFDYGNEAQDTRDGTPVFNGNDAVWFVFASNLYEACRTMFTNREAIGAWNSVTYHNYLLSEQQKVPERVWNECYWYDYLRTYENSIETTWINFLDGGQKTHQRKHYETYEEIYDSSKYRGSFSHNQSITLRGEAIDYTTLGLPAQESKFTITMFNKCYLTIWIGTNFKTIKCEKGIPVTLEFYERENILNYSEWEPLTSYIVKTKVNYNGWQYECIADHVSQAEQTPDIDTINWKPVWLSLANSVIDIDSGSMVQAIGDLSRIYPSSGQFGAAKRLRSLQIGSDTTGYYNPNMNNNSILTFNNKMLEYLYVQNLPQATYNLDLSNCPELKLLNAAGSGFTGFVFANGGLLNEAHLNAPNSLVMRNLNVLTKTNFDLTDPTAVTSLRLENCSLFDNQQFLSELTNLNVLRLTNINWSLSTNTLLDRLVNLMGIDESGFTISQSYLSGTVTLTGTVYEGVYNTYVNAWSPDLTINTTGSFIYQHLVTYYNGDEENGYTKVYETYINSGSNLIDPYATEALTTAPSKNPDIQYSYTFGELDNSEAYIPFSGWREQGETESIYTIYNTRTPSIAVNGNMNLYAVYSTLPQRYIVRWLLDENREVTRTESGQNYGGGYNLVAPTIKDVQAKYPTYTFTLSGNNCSYSIMTGWNKLPTNITPTAVGTTYDIYATWLTRTNINYNTILTSNEYSVEEKLLVLKNVQAARNSYLHIADKFSVKMGYDGLKSAIDLISTPTRYTGSITTINDYEPFAANKSFTMAIDYRFEAITNNIANEAVLLSCYSDTDEQGFKLYYNPQSGVMLPQVSFGSTSSSSAANIQIVGSSITNRNIIVIRHRAGENTLYVYTGSGAGGLVNEYSSANFRKTINWSSNTSNAKIVLGGINTTNASSMNATGTLYSVKYWEEDLGDGECLQLANWCHETIEFAVADFYEAEVHSSINTNLAAKLVLHTLNASEMGTYAVAAANITTESTIGWNPSAIRDLYNNRIYYGLPVLLQSILMPNPQLVVPFKAATYTNENGYIINQNTSTSQDYVFAPSCVEVGATGEIITNHSTEAISTYNWYSASQMTIKQYNNGELDTIQSGDANYTNLRFPYRANELNKSVTVYVNYPNTGTSFYRWLINDKSGTLNSGDILIPSGDSTVAYMYVTAAEINKGAPIVNASTGYLSNTIGGWIESTGWWTRSVPNQNANRNYSKFYYINDIGTLTIGNDREHGIVYSIAL